MSDKQAEILRALERIKANIERAEMRQAWRNIDESTIEERYEFWVKTERSDQSSVNY